MLPLFFFLACVLCFPLEAEDPRCGGGARVFRFSGIKVVRRAQLAFPPVHTVVIVYCDHGQVVDATELPQVPWSQPLALANRTVTFTHHPTMSELLAIPARVVGSVAVDNATWPLTTDWWRLWLRWRLLSHWTTYLAAPKLNALY